MRRYILILVALAIFLIPNVLWGNLYVVGGDDTRLYYLFPFQYLTNYSFNVISGNALGGNLGYFPVSYSVPIIVLLLIVKQLLPQVNTQFVAFGAIFSLGFVFFYYFLQEWVSKKTTFYFWVSIVVSICYILSPYLARTYFQHQLISIFLLTVLPACLYFFVTGVRRNSVVRVIVSSLIYSVFSSTVYSFPWLLAVIFTLVPFFIFLAISYGRYFWKMVVVFIGVTLLCNFYWIVHFIVPLLYKTGETEFAASLVSDTFKQQNNDLIVALSYLNSPVHQMINYLRTSWQDRQGPSLWQTVGIGYLAIILLAGMLLGRVKRNIRILYLFAIAGLLLTMLCITPNFGLWNVQLFQFLNTRVPFFGIVRHMYDKFALAMAFHYAFTLFIAFIVLSEAKVKQSYRYFCIIGIFVITCILALPYIRLSYNDATHSTRISGLNKDFLDLAGYIKNLNTTSRFAWFPMTFAGYVYISDEAHVNHYYEGLSPLRIFAGASDVAGFYGLQTPSDPELNWKVLNLLKQKNYKEVGIILKRLNVGYIIVNNDEVPKRGPFVLEQFDFVKYQSEEYKQAILGEKIRDFGNRYSLYAMNSDFRSSHVFLTENINDIQAPAQSVEFHRESDGTYTIGPVAVSKMTHLVLMEPYSRLWSIERLDGYKHATVRDVSTLAYGYGNSWVLDPARLGSPTVRVRVEFWPNRLILPSLIISIAGGVLAGLYGVVAWLKSRKKR